jgi:hypothetical protein
MKPLARDFSMTRLIALGCALLGSALIPAGAAAQCRPAAPPLPADLLAAAAEPGAYPSFCSIPPTPVGVRDAAAFRSAVLDTRVAGVRLLRQTAPSTFTLEGTDAYALIGRAEAAPPRPMTAPGEAAADFANAARHRATPPKRRR